ncbi:MAG: DUF1684 domain-containing protein [Ktedonobacterales bacterium]
MSGPDVAREYQQMIETRRRGTDEAFAQDPASPIPHNEQAGFKGLIYFPANAAFRIEATLTPFAQPEVVLLGSTKGDMRERLRFGELHFALQGAECRLTAFKDAGDPDGAELFVPFRDATTSRETYGAGRYVEAEDTGGGMLPRTVVLDFNLAYNPWCAYNPDYSCILPPRENVLPVAVEAGERTFGDGH